MRRSEGLTLCALALLALVTVVVRPEGGALRLAVFTGLAAATTLLARRPGRRGLGFLRDWLPAGVVIVVFLLLQPIIEATASWRLDAALISNIEMPPPPGSVKGFIISVQVIPSAYLGAATAMMITLALASFFPARRAARAPIVESLAHV